MNRSHQETKPTSETEPSTEADRRDAVVNISRKQTTKCTDISKKYCKIVGFICIIVMVALAASVLTAKYLSSAALLESSSDDLPCKTCDKLVS